MGMHTVIVELVYSVLLHERVLLASSNVPTQKSIVIMTCIFFFVCTVAALLTEF